MTLGRRWLEGAVSRVTEKTTAWTEDERREMAEQKERDNYDAYERDEHGDKLRIRWPDDPPDSNDDVLEQLRKVTTGGGT